MKTQTKLMIVAILLMTPVMLFAQRGQGQGREMKERLADALELTEDQQTKIEAIHTAQMKESLQFRNQLNEYRARLQSLRTAESADLKAINGTIDDITQVQASMMKTREASHQEVRKVLNEEQRVKFDSMQAMRRNRSGRGQGQGAHWRGRGGAPARDK
jgi:Spy/CpxP family protein refolding chaperone